jgi:hypothetical protein
MWRMTMEKERSMEVRTAYCSACDRNVRVVLKPGADDEGQAPEASDLICLEHGETCTGDMCPIFDVPTEQMRENLKRLLEEEGQPESGRTT